MSEQVWDNRAPAPSRRDNAGGADTVGGAAGLDARAVPAPRGVHRRRAPGGDLAGGRVPLSLGGVQELTWP